MQAVNEPAGLRGTLSRALEQKPAIRREWNRIRASAARAIVSATDRRVYPTARRGLQQLAAQWAACHEEHR
jgi:hypothetical protein